MANVLPPEVQQNVWRLQLGRFMIAGALIAIGCAVLSALALIPSYLVLHADEIAARTSTKSAADTKDHDAIAQTQTLIAAFAPLVHATTTPTEAIQHALDARPKGISVQHITYAFNPKTSSIMLVGSAASREALSTFRGALGADRLFQTVTVPVADLAAAEGGEFSVTLTGNF